MRLKKKYLVLLTYLSAFNAKIEVKNKISNITNLATTTAVTVVEN